MDSSRPLPARRWHALKKVYARPLDWLLVRRVDLLEEEEEKEEKEEEEEEKEEEEEWRGEYRI